MELIERKTGHSIQEIGKKMKSKEMVSKFLQMDLHMKENFIRDFDKAKVNIYLERVMFMKDNSFRMNFMAKELFLTKMGKFTQESFKRTKNMDMGNLSGEMVHHIMETM